MSSTTSLDLESLENLENRPLTKRFLMQKQNTTYANIFALLVMQKHFVFGTYSSINMSTQTPTSTGRTRREPTIPEDPHAEGIKASQYLLADNVGYILPETRTPIGFSNGIVIISRL